MKIRTIYSIFVICACFLITAFFLTNPNQTINAQIEKIEKIDEENSSDIAETFDKLIIKAEKDGYVRVIVKLKVNFKPEGKLTDSLVDKQRNDIRKKQELVLEKLAEKEVSEIKTFKYTPFLAFQVDSEALKILREDKNVVDIYEDIPQQATLIDSVQAIGAPIAWDSGLTGTGQTVAVLDTGVDKNHPFLSGKVTSEACYSSNFPASNVSSVCPGGVTESTSSNSGLHCDISVNGCNHGTHVAGIAAGKLTSSNFYGVARDASIVAIQVFSRFDNDSSCNGSAPCVKSYTSDQMKGLERVQTLNNSLNMASANMSLGGGQFFSNCDTNALKPIIDNLRSLRIATVISSGNDGFTNSMGSPACISSAISVGSTDDGSLGTTIDTVSNFSNSASFLNLLAPGRWIQSSVPGGYANFQGTSMAAPHVAGTWAILKQRNPNISVTGALNILSNTGVPIQDARNAIVKPRIQVNSAASLAGANCVNNQITIGQTTNGQTLSNTDCSFTNNLSLFLDFYTFTGNAGQQVSISMNSSAFNTILRLQSSNGQILAVDDNGGGGTNSQILFTLPSTGTYNVIAYSTAPNSFGTYTLSLSEIGSIQVTVQTNPSGRTFSVDGTTYSSPQTFNWQQGSNHTIATTSSQTSGSTRYIWNNWSDGGAITHTVSPNSSTIYTANFTTQHFLTMNADSGGTISPSSGWFNAGQSVQISANPNSGFNFNGWTGSGNGSYTGANNPVSISMNSPIIQTASFSSVPNCNYSINPTSQGFNASGGNGNINVTTNTGCNWTSSSNVGWITITGGASGSGNGTSNFSVAQNTSTSQRQGTIAIAGQTFTVIQAGQQPSCSYSITPTSRHFNLSGGTGTFTVNAPAGCIWTATVNSSLLESLTNNYREKFETFIKNSLKSPATTFPANSATLGAIPDGPGPGAQNPGLLRDITFSVSGTTLISSLSLSITGTHTWLGDLEATLIAPDGTSHKIFGYTGATTSTSFGDSSDFGGTYTFADNASPPTGGWWQEATVRLASESLSAGSYRTTNSGGAGAINPMPATSMNNAFSNVSNPNGIWILRVTDGGAQDTGSITAASLTIGNSTQPNWLEITSGTSGNGSGTVNYSVLPSSIQSRAGELTISANGQSHTMHTVTQSSSMPINNTKFDFDGDNKTDVSIFRPGPTPAQWWLLRSSDGGNNAVSFGLGSDTPVPADFTGDGKTDFAFFRASSNEWFVLRSEDQSFFSFPFGASGDIPAPGDFDGDGIADAAVFRPSTGTWFINRSSDGNTDIIGFGSAEDKPVVADYDGDGMDDVAIYRPSVSQWWISRSTDGVLVFQFGQTGDKTVHGDYTGDGKADVAFWRPASGEWFVIRSEDQSFFSFPFGANGDIPVPGDYDGDGEQDAAVFRPSTATWFINGSTSGTQILGFGASTDIPLANSFITE